MIAERQLLQGEGQDTRLRIVKCAQRGFSSKGFSETRIQDIALQAGVAPSLVIKYFGSKSNLFREALKDGMKASTFREELKANFAATLIRATSDPHREIFPPAMMALSLGDEEARQITSEVVRDHIVSRVAEWLGPPDAEARAANIFMLSTGFVIFNRHLDIITSDEARRVSAAWVAEQLQGLIYPAGYDVRAAHRDDGPVVAPKD